MKLKLLALFFLSVSGQLFSQHRRSNYDSANFKHPYGIYFSIGVAHSGVDIYKRYFQNPHRYGFNARMYGEFSNSMRIVAEFTRIPKYNQDTSWRNLGAYNLDLNMQFMARMKDGATKFYLLCGANLHSWKGDFLKQSPYYDAIVYYKPNTTISSSLFGINLGMGLEYAFKYFEIFGDFRYRVSQFQVNFGGISDQSLNFGIKKKFPLHKIFRDPNDRYKWF